MARALVLGGEPEDEPLSGDVVVVVPCFNEAQRLDVARFEGLARCPGVSLLFVDDGSKDSTGTLLTSLAARCPRVDALHLAANVGKGEAVRVGMREALDRPSTSVVAYYDADMAAPPAELLRVLAVVRGASDVDVALASRVALLGRRIERSRWRHYQGRLFASAASAVLRAPIYDTQCGLKVMRATPALRCALDAPFSSRWAFDVELLQRLFLHSNGSPLQIVEVPLMEWRDVSGSQLSAVARGRAFVDVLAMGWREQVWRHRTGPQIAKYSSANTTERPVHSCSPISSTDVSGGADLAG